MWVLGRTCPVWRLTRSYTSAGSGRYVGAPKKSGICRGIEISLRSFRTQHTLMGRNKFCSQFGRFWLALVLLFFIAVATLWGQAPNEKLLSEENGYNPIPSPNGKLIAYVRTGWGRPGGGGG